MNRKTIFAISDIHLEFLPNVKSIIEKIPSADILVLAGDIGNVTHKSNDIECFLNDVKSKYRDVVYVAGNHEFYNCSFDRKSN
jgi:predicted MPP superfamily phosphohydrolase